MADEELNKQIVTQVEYYMSDVNLKRDSFFQKEMTKHDGFIAVDVLLKCNKLKKLTTDGDLVMSALEASTELIVSDDKKKVKRKTPPPPLDEDVAKRAKQKERGGDVDADALKKAIEEKAEKAVKDRLVYKVGGLPAGLAWTVIKDTIKEIVKPGGKMFIQHEDGATEAHVSATVGDGNEDKFAEAADKGDALKINETTFTLTKVDDEAALKAYWLDQFTKNPPKELEKEMKKAQRGQKRGRGKEESSPGKKRKGAPPSGPVTFGSTTFSSKDEAKTKAMEMAKRNPDTELEVLEGADREFAAAILEFHPKAEEKKKGLKDFAVGKNPEHPTTRCFFAVKEDGSKVDFSYIKCIDAAPEDGNGAGSPKSKKAKSEGVDSPKGSRSSPRLKAASPKAKA